MLLDKIQSDLKEAMLARNEVKTSTLRMVIAAASNARIAKQTDLSDDDLISIIQKEAKEREESAATAKEAGRDDLIQKNMAENEILQVYLPDQLTHDELTKLVDETITEVGAQAPADIGKVMTQLMPKVRGRADGGMVSKLVTEHLLR